MKSVIEFRKILFMVIEETFSSDPQKFWEELGLSAPENMSVEDAMMDLVEQTQLIVGLFLRKYASELTEDEAPLELKFFLSMMGAELLSDIKTKK